MGLTQEQLKEFNQEGYVVIRSALQDTDIEQVIRDYEEIIDKLAKDLLTAGRISHLYENEPFERRLARICDEDDATYFASDQFLDVGHVRGKGTFNFMRNQKLLDLVESIIGPEISCSPMTHIRAKLPSDLGRGRNSNIVSWHQDAIFLHQEADQTFILTVWLPLCNAVEENGCLRIMPRIHKNRTVYWDNSLPNKAAVTVPMKRGDVVFIHKLTPHSSGPNQTDAIRWSMDIRYQKKGTPTGRSFWPGFDARSRLNPDAETSYETWQDHWILALEKYPKKVPRENRPNKPLPYQGEM